MGDVRATAEHGEKGRVRRTSTWRAFAGAVLVVAVAAVVAVVVRNDDDTLRLSRLPQGVTAHVVDGNDVFVSRHGNEVRVLLPAPGRLPDDLLWWCPNEQVFIEVRRATFFDRNGRWIVGPAAGALDQHPVELDGDRLVIDTDTVIRGTHTPRGEMPDGVPTSGAGLFPPNSGPDSICQDPVAAPPSAARQLEPPAGPGH
jgi:hypothetical protein